MYYTIYKTTNKLNGKFYIGKHQTRNLNDRYLGSGKLLKRAIAKHGIENFEKHILFIYDNEDDMNRKEKELVVISEQSYNLCEGGKGGFGYINKNGLAAGGNPAAAGKEGYRKTFEKMQLQYGSTWKSILKCRGKVTGDNNVLFKRGIFRTDIVRFSWLGKRHTEETKQKLRMFRVGKFTKENNSQYGTFWVTDGIKNKKCKPNESIPVGFWRGRKGRKK